MATPNATTRYVDPHNVQTLELYTALARLMEKEILGGRNPHIGLDTTEYNIEPSMLENALAAVGVTDEDIPAAIDYLVEIGMIDRLMLDRKDKEPSVSAYYLTHKGLAFYHGMNE